MTKGLALMLTLFTLSMYLSARQVLNSIFIEAVIIKVQIIKNKVLSLLRLWLVFKILANK